MAQTAIGQMAPEQMRVWSQEAIRTYRQNLFFQKFIGKGEDSVIQMATDLTKTEMGDRCMIGLVADAARTGIVGDNNINGRESALEATWVEIQCDQLRKPFTSKGRVSARRSPFGFRKIAKDALAKWRADVIEDLMIMTASGVSYAFNTDGSPRIPNGEDDLSELSFGQLVTPPSSERHYRFDGTNLQLGDTTQMTAGHVPKYGALVDMVAEASSAGIKPINVNGQNSYVYLCHPKVLAALKKDPDFRDVLANAGDRGAKNPLLSGATVTMDGLIIHTTRSAFHTMGAASGSKWGAGGAVNGTRSLLMGVQALAFGDLWGNARWFEGREDHDNKEVISMSMYIGLVKPKFKATATSTLQDFGVMALDLAI